MAKIYWYAPFDNADETSLAIATSEFAGLNLTVQSCDARFGRPFPGRSPGAYRLVRDLPAPAGEDGARRTVWHRLRVARMRASLRQQLVAEGGFDVVHLHTYNPFTDWYAIPRLLRHTRIVIQSVHNVRPHERILPQPLETLVLRRGYRACTRLIVAHDSLKEDLIKDFGVPAERIHIVPLPITCKPSSIALPALARTDPSPQTRFLFFGTFRRNKGMPVLLDAISRLRTHDDLRFTFAGRGEAALERLVTEASRTDSRIDAQVGYIDNDRIDDLFASADVVVIPYTEFHAQSGVLQDAYGYSRPVIAADIGALGASVRSDGTGWLVRPGDAADLARAIVEVAAAPDDRLAAARRTADIASERSASAIARMFSALYDELLSSR